LLIAPIETPDVQNKLLLFDGHALAFTSWFSSDSIEAKNGFFRMLHAAVRKYTPTHVIVAFDPPPPTFRHKLYPAYKGNRPPVPLRLLEECDLIRERLTADGIAMCTVVGYEADDVLGTLTRHASLLGFHTTVITCDLDILQLVSADTIVEVFSQYWPTRIFDIAATVQRFGGLAPGCIPDYKALVGDRSDNLPGVPGIGDGAATAILREYGDLESVYANIESIPNLKIRGSKRIARILTEHRELAFVMKTLTTIVRTIDLSGALLGDNSRILSFPLPALGSHAWA
jgi:DNA polymerase-1